MKTQRPRSSFDKRPSPGAAQGQNGSNDNDIEDGDQIDGIGNGAMRKVPPTLPKRKSGRPNPTDNKAVAASTATVAAAEPKQADTEPLPASAAPRAEAPRAAAPSAAV